MSFGWIFMKFGKEYVDVDRSRVD